MSERRIGGHTREEWLKILIPDGSPVWSRRELINAAFDGPPLTLGEVLGSVESAMRARQTYTGPERKFCLERVKNDVDPIMICGKPLPCQDHGCLYA